VEPPQNILWLIFKIYLKLEKLLLCYFYYSKSTTYFDLNPVWLDGSFHELSKYIKFIKNDRADLKRLKIWQSM
jgi:hypothetical protein